MGMSNRNKILHGHVIEKLKELPSSSIDCVITSPPYYSVRDYGIEEVVWDGDLTCEHQWVENTRKTEGYKNKSGFWQNPNRSRQETPEAWQQVEIKEGFCLKCGAWLGCLGLEPNYELYIKHLCDVFDEVKRVLKDTGIVFVNLGDTHAGGGGIIGIPEDWESISTNSNRKKYPTSKPSKRVENIPSQSLMLLPQRFAIEMVNRGWILRNVIIWYKPNCMPSSAKDRFTIDFEYIYFFTKSNKNKYFVNEKTTLCQHKQPTNKIEGIDWEFRECNKCFGTGIKHLKCKTCEGEGMIYSELYPIQCETCKGKGKIKGKIKQKEKCKRCKGTGQRKYNLWSGRKYYFDQDAVREQHLTNEYKGNGRRGLIKGNVNIGHEQRHSNNINYSPKGRNKRCVWKIPTKSCKAAHFAVFPNNLVIPMIKSGCPKQVCAICGLPKEKIIEKTVVNTEGWGKANKDHHLSSQSYIRDNKGRCGDPKSELIGYTDCGCNSYVPGLVLDIFAGTGTTMKAAWKLGRDAIGIEISEEYIEMEGGIKDNTSETKTVRLDKWLSQP